MSQIGELGEVLAGMKNPNRGEVIDFFDGLKASVLKAIADGIQVHIERKEATDPVYSDSGMLVDYRWMGCKFKIYIGRKASERRYKLSVKDK